MSKKIIIISPAYPFRGGIAHFTDSLFNELIKRFDVEVITFTRQYPSFLFPGKTQKESFGDEAQKIPAQQLIDSINPFNWLKVGNAIKKLNPDYVVFAYWMPFFAPCFGFISSIIKKNPSIKIIALCHNILPHEKRIGDLSFTKYFFKFMDGFILLSGMLKNDLLKIIPTANYKILFHPVYSVFGDEIDRTEARKKLNLPDKKIILFFGIIRDYKGLDNLINAIKHIKNKEDKLLVIAGEFYSNKERYFSLIEKQQLQNYVLAFDEFIPNDSVKYYFSSADLVVLPYRDATQSGVSQIAMNFNKPIIATNVGGLSEFVADGKTGYVVEKNNPKKLAGAINLFFDDDKYEEFSANTKIEKEKYSWNSFVDLCYNFLTEKI